MMHVKTVLSRGSGRFLLRNAMILFRRKDPVGHLVSMMGAPTKRTVEVYVVGMEAGQLAVTKDVPKQCGAEVFVGGMAQSKHAKYAVMKGVPALPKKEESVGVMGES